MIICTHKNLVEGAKSPLPPPVNTHDKYSNGAKVFQHHISTHKNGAKSHLAPPVNAHDKYSNGAKTHFHT